MNSNFLDFSLASAMFLLMLLTICSFVYFTPTSHTYFTSSSSAPPFIYLVLMYSRVQSRWLWCEMSPLAIQAARCSLNL